MSLRSCLITLLLLAGGPVYAADSPPSIPDTPAGHVLAEWLDAFNSGDGARAESFVKTHAQWIGLESIMRWRTETGGYDLLAIHSSDQMDVVFRVKARTGAEEEIGRISVKATEPWVVTELGTWRIPAGAKFEPVTLDAAARARLVDSVAGILDSLYVYPETARQMAAAVRARERRGEYHSIVDGEDFARKLTTALRDVSHDKHVEVRFSFVAQPADLKHPEDESAARRRLAAINCGFEKAEHLPPNIGYLKVNVFADPEICAATAGAAMTFLADTDSLILDLRDNGGGSGAMAQFISSYLFAEPTHLMDTYKRQAQVTEESWTLPYVPGKKFVGKPVFVLTSKQTFSAAEALSYALKTLKRASVIGETTGGGAHPVESKRIDDHFSVRVPTGRSISPITKADWEGTGVEPDIKVAAADALDETLARARSNGQAATPVAH
jgi:hypothetical protein